jgi:hypothetical protein
MASFYSFIFLANLALDVEASSACWTSIRNDTIAYHNSAPITFSNVGEGSSIIRAVSRLSQRDKGE